MIKSFGRQAALCFVAALAMAATAPARAQDQLQDDQLQDLLGDVGENYARAYLAPFTYSLGPNLNSGIYHTAAIPLAGVSVDLGVKVMGTHLSEEDRAFRTVIENVDLGDYTTDPAYSGETGDIVLSGPTIFGDTNTQGTIDGYLNGVQVFSESGIEGLVESRYSPMVVPQASVAGVVGLRATIRWLPEIDLPELGKTKLFGYGLQWTLNGVASTLPVDVMIGFFRQTLDVGTLMETDANSRFVAVSKSWTAVTVYGGYAREDSEMSLSYFYSDGGQNIAFTVDDTQESRLTLGATLNIGAKLNFEMAHGDLTTYTAGLMIGF